MQGGLRVKIRVYYEDTDAGGIVYHSKYINFCERARSELFFHHGMVPTEGEKSGFVVKHIEADFLGSAMLGDLLSVTTTLLERKHTSDTLMQEVYKEKQKLFSMHILLVYMANGKISRIPEAFKTLLDAYQTKA